MRYRTAACCDAHDEKPRSATASEMSRFCLAGATAAKSGRSCVATLSLHLVQAAARNENTDVDAVITLSATADTALVLVTFAQTFAVSIHP